VLVRPDGGQTAAGFLAHALARVALLLSARADGSNDDCAEAELAPSAELAVLRAAALLCEACGPAGLSAAPLATPLARSAACAGRAHAQLLATHCLATLARADAPLVGSLLVAHVLPLVDARTPQSVAGGASGALALLVLQLLDSPGSGSEQLVRYVELARARSAGSRGDGAAEEPAWLSRLTPLMV
jgi:hypothetical protein